MDVTVKTVVDGEFDVHLAGRVVRVFVPPGLGVAGVADETFVWHVVTALLAHDMPVADVVDLAQVMARNPAIFAAVSDALADANTDTV